MSRPEYGNWEGTYANEHQRPERDHSRGGAARGADASAAGPHGGGTNRLYRLEPFQELDGYGQPVEGFRSYTSNAPQVVRGQG